MIYHISYVEDASTAYIMMIYHISYDIQLVIPALHAFLISDIFYSQG